MKHLTRTDALERNHTAPAAREPLRVLMVEDDENDAELVCIELNRGAFALESKVVKTAEAMRAALLEQDWDLVISDYSMPGFNGLGAFAIVRELDLDIPFIFISGVMGEERAVEAMRAGARDYLLKGKLGRLNAAVTRELAAAAHRAELRKAQDDLREYAAALERSNNDLEQFAQIASHDLQEPLRMVASYTELLAQRYRGQLDEKADKFIGYAVEGAKRMQQLINDLLAYSRVGTQELHLALTDSSAVLARTLRDLSLALEGAEVSYGELPTLCADATQLGRLFQNLIGNSLRFRSERPVQIQVSAKRVDNYWQFSVEDNGIGINEEYSEQVFQMFRRLHERGKYEGSGVGLAVAKRVVERHGGQIWFESKPDHGTTFHFTLLDMPAGQE